MGNNVTMSFVALMAAVAILAYGLGVKGGHHVDCRDSLEDVATWLDAEQMLHPPPYTPAGQAIRYLTLEHVKTHIREMENER